MHIPAEKRKKLEDRSEALILVGYHSTGAFKLYNPEKKQIVIRRDVVVDEAAKLNWEPVAVTAEKSHIPCLLEDKAAATTSINSGNNTNRRSQRVRFPSTRLTDHEVMADCEIRDDGELVHLEFMADSEPLMWEQAVDIRE